MPKSQLSKLFLIVTLLFSAYAHAVEYDIPSIPVVLESGDIELKNQFDISSPLYGVTNFISIVDYTSGVEVRRLQSSGAIVSGAVSLIPGIYELTSGFSANYQPRCNGCPATVVNGSGPTKIFTVTGVPNGVYQVYPDPLVLNPDDCNANFSLNWEKDSDPGVISSGGKVLYTIEEESAPDNGEFTGSWVVIEGAHPSVDNNPATQSEPLETYHFKASKAPGRKYRYRVSTRYIVGGHQSRAVMNHEGFGSIRKYNCSTNTATNTADITALKDKSILNIAPALANGVSVNRIDNFNGSGFNVKDRPLVIHNFLNASGKAAELIVIESSAVRISKPISILGQNAALLIVNNSNSNSAYFECVDQCEFHNVNRVTLANAKRDSSYGSGALQLNNTSTMRVNGLVAPGAHSVEIMGGNVEVDGFLTSNLKATRKFPSGDIELHPGGSLSAGVGAIGIFAGGLFVNYASLNIERVRPLNTSDANVLGKSTIKGNIQAANISIVSTEHIDIDAHLNTNADVFLATAYKKKSYIPGDVDKLYTPVEVVRLETFGRKAVFNMNGTVTTKAAAHLVSNNHLNVRNSLYAHTLNLVAGNNGKLTIRSGVSLMADYINAAANSLENNGLIAASVSADIAADIALVNQFGGKVTAPSVKLTSTQGYVRNGSLVPYRQTSSAANVQSSASAQGYQSGTYYDIDTDGATSSNTQKVGDLSAKIIAGNLEINAATNVENINPYFEVNTTDDDWSDSVPFASKLTHQVGLYGTRDISIKAGEKILNSSAEIMQLDTDGKLSLATKNLVNQRYRTEVILGNYLSTKEGRPTRYNCHGHDDCSTEAFQIEATLSVNPILYSPPGLIYVAGHMNADAYSTSPPKLSTLNDASYVEVMGDADFYGSILSVGVLDYELHFTHAYDSCISYASGWCSSSDSYDTNVNYVGELDALFRVHGSFKGPKVDWVEDNDDAVLAFVAKATATTVTALEHKVSEGTFEAFIQANFDKIVSYIETFKNSLLKAWDVITDWFA